MNQENNYNNNLKIGFGILIIVGIVIFAFALSMMISTPTLQTNHPKTNSNPSELEEKNEPTQEEPKELTKQEEITKQIQDTSLDNDAKDILNNTEEIKNSLYDTWPDLQIETQKDNILRLRLISTPQTISSKISLCKGEKECKKQVILLFLDDLIAERDLCIQTVEKAKDNYNCEEKIISYSYMDLFPDIPQEAREKETLEDMKIVISG